MKVSFLILSIGLVMLTAATKHPVLKAEEAGTLPFTADQADAGILLFQQHCSSCHSVSEFSGDQFDAIWRGQSVYSLYEIIMDTMPPDQPGSLTRPQVSAIVSNLLRENDFLPASEPLPDDPELLKRITIQ